MFSIKENSATLQVPEVYEKPLISYWLINSKSFHKVTLNAPKWLGWVGAPVPDKTQEEGWRHRVSVLAKPSPDPPGGGRRSFWGWSHLMVFSLSLIQSNKVQNNRWWCFRFHWRHLWRETTLGLNKTVKTSTVSPQVTRTRGRKYNILKCSNTPAISGKAADVKCKQ